MMSTPTAPRRESHRHHEANVTAARARAMLGALCLSMLGCRPGTTEGVRGPDDTTAETTDEEREALAGLGTEDPVSAAARDIALGRPDRALKGIEGALAEAPEDPELHLARGAALQAMGRGDAAIEAWERTLELKPSMYGALDGIGTVHLDAGRPEQALGFFRQALDIQPNFSAGQYNYALALRAVGKPELALDALQRAASLAPDDGAVLLERASVLEALGRVEEARAAVRDAAVKAPEDAWVQMVLGDVLVAENPGDPAAVAAYARAHELEPAMAEARGRLLGALLRLGRLEEAAEISAAAVTRAGDDPLAWSDRASVQRVQGDLQGASESLARALTLDPALAAAHRRAVRWAAQDGDCDRARAALRRMEAAGTPASAQARARAELEKTCPGGSEGS